MCVAAATEDSSCAASHGTAVSRQRHEKINKSWGGGGGELGTKVFILVGGTSAEISRQPEGLEGAGEQSKLKTDLRHTSMRSCSGQFLPRVNEHSTIWKK